VRLPAVTAAALALSLAAPTQAFTWPNAAERVEKELAKSDVAARRRAASQLGELPEGVGKRLVLQALGDADADVRLSAANLVLERRIRGTGEAVLAWLNDPDRRIRLAAADILRLDPVDKAVAPLGRVLGDPDSGVRSAAAAALASIGAKDSVLPLLGHLDDAVPQVRIAVVRALSRIRDSRAVVPLIGKVQDSRPAVRRAVVRALGELGDPRAVSALVLALRDSDDSVRIAALEALGALGDKGSTLAISALVEDDPRSPVRAAALEALARIGTPEALDRVVSALETDDPADPMAPARRALGSAGKSAAKRLEQCLAGQPSKRVADGCALALSDIGAPKAAKTIVSALRRGVVSSTSALAALTSLADPSALPTVLEHLSESDPTVRRAAVDATAALLDPRKPDGRAVDPIAKALEHARSHHAERAALSRLLGRTGSPRAVPLLKPLAEAADAVELRIAAIEALGMIPPVGQDETLLEALDAEEPSVRLAAALALRRAASGAAARALLDRLDRSAEQDRGAVAVALGGALSRSKDPAMLERALSLLEASRGGQRDALIEAIGRFPGKKAVERLGALARQSGDVADRAKIAEALSGRGDALAELERLAADADGSVRANAIWALGSVAGAPQKKVLARAAEDRDVAVAGNAVAALGRLGRRHKLDVRTDLCSRLADTRPYVRANALAALRVAGARCSSDRERTMVGEDRSEAVRRAGAALLANVPGKDPARDRDALEACAADDPDGSVAAACAARPEKVPATTDPVAVYVVPMGESEPVARAPFALVLADGLMRLGVADRRGELFEKEAPTGELTLTVPAPLVR
jgi:HEAT repeat protein